MRGRVCAAKCVELRARYSHKGYSLYGIQRTGTREVEDNLLPVDDEACQAVRDNDLRITGRQEQWGEARKCRLVAVCLSAGNPQLRPPAGIHRHRQTSRNTDRRPKTPAGGLSIQRTEPLGRSASVRIRNNNCALLQAFSCPSRRTCRRYPVSLRPDLCSVLS